MVMHAAGRRRSDRWPGSTQPEGAARIVGKRHALAAGLRGRLQALNSLDGRRHDASVWRERQVPSPRRPSRCAKGTCRHRGDRVRDVTSLETAAASLRAPEEILAVTGKPARALPTTPEVALETVDLARESWKRPAAILESRKAPHGHRGAGSSPVDDSCDHCGDHERGVKVLKTVAESLEHREKSPPAPLRFLAATRFTRR